mmetsp:Transcript_121565/g.389267  ORF Transcript_121565/g.389267 Transcript_121565/m.389267 type:complete len:338 (-) Transcript_121565:120-1133(-)
MQGCVWTGCGWTAWSRLVQIHCAIATWCPSWHPRPTPAPASSRMSPSPSFRRRATVVWQSCTAPAAAPTTTRGAGVASRAEVAELRELGRWRRRGHRKNPPQAGSGWRKCPEVGLYDTAGTFPRQLTAFARHTDLVTDVCAISAQSFASASLDGSLLLWDIRVGLEPAARAGFALSGEPPRGAGTGVGLCSIAAAHGRGLLLCGDLSGGLVLFDTRALARPLARLQPARGALVRLRLWEECGASGGQGQVGGALIAAAASSEDGLCSLTLSGPISGLASRAGPPLRALRSSGGEGAPPLCYDIARALGGGAAVFAACGAEGVTRFRSTRSEVPVGDT